MRIPSPILAPQTPRKRPPTRGGARSEAHPRRWRWALLLALLAGALLLPAAAYVAGGALIGPYEGKRGLATYLGTLYHAAGQGRLPALLVLLGPAASMLVWRLRKAILHWGSAARTPQ